MPFLLLFLLFSFNVKAKTVPKPPSSKLIYLNLDLSNAFLKAQEQWKKDHPTWPQVYSFCTYRCNDYQNWLYASGRTRRGSIVTNARANSSPHNKYPSLAIDVVFKDKDDKEIWGDKYYVLFSKYMIKQGYVWGGSFSTIYDYPHFEYPNWKKLKINRSVVPKPF